MSPKFEPADIVFQEWFASGASQKNYFTKFGGAQNCLRLVVTKEYLWVKSWGPFSIFAPIFDLEHLIPLESILSVHRSWDFIVSSILLTFRDTRGERHSLRLYSWKPNDFIRSLGGERDEALSARSSDIG
jgi:hypothetical protein